MSESPQSELTAHARKNKALWEKTSDSYEELHAAALSDEQALAWGLWRLPEKELRLLGDVQGKDVLEFGCGAARWSMGLARQGARPVGLDLSSQQLSHARRLMAEAGMDFPLIEASAEAVPLPDASFDLVFCDWGAMTFCDPHLTIPEASRLLRPGGRLVFSTAAPIQSLCYNSETDHTDRQLLRDYFGLTRLEWEDEVDFQLPYGEWIRLFRQSAFVIEDLLETRPPVGVTSTYRDESENEWARRWPMENIWCVRKEGNRQVFR